MTTNVGIGFSENPKSYDAGVEASNTALRQAGTNSCDLAILFSTSKHDPFHLRDGVRSIIGSKAKLIGGYGNGVITNKQLGYEGYQVGVAILSSNTIKVDMFIEKELPDNEYNAAISLANQIEKNKFVGIANGLLFLDLIRGEPTDDLLLNGISIPLFVEGFKKADIKNAQFAGIGLIGDWQFNPTYQFFNNDVQQNSAMSLILHGDVHMDVKVIHGLVPSSQYHTITKVKDNIILEIDNKSAVDTICDVLNVESKALKGYMITIGINHGDKFEDYDPENYINSIVLGVDMNCNGLIMHRSDFHEGMEFQTMRQNFTDFEYIHQCCSALLEQIGNRHPILAMYLDCAIRASAYCKTEREDAEIVQDVIGSKVPLLGIYDGSEIAMIKNELQATIWNSLLVIFSE